MKNFIFVFICLHLSSICYAGNFQILYGDWPSVLDYFNKLINYDSLNGCKFNIKKNTKYIKIDVTDTWGHKVSISVKLDSVESSNVEFPYAARLLESYDLPDRNISNVLHVEANENGNPSYFEYLEFNTIDIVPTTNIFCGTSAQERQ